MLDHEQDWIEKYRAALAEPTPSRRSRLAAALSAVTTALGAAIGLTSGKIAKAPQRALASKQSTKIEVPEHHGADPHPNLDRASKKSAPLEHRQDKKAS